MAAGNEVIHPQLMAVLAVLHLKPGPAFSVKEMCELTDGNPGAHLRRLEESRSIIISKTFLESTPAGRKAFSERVCFSGEEVRRARNSRVENRSLGKWVESAAWQARVRRHCAPSCGQAQQVNRLACFPAPFLQSVASMPVLIHALALLSDFWMDPGWPNHQSELLAGPGDSACTSGCFSPGGET